MLMLNNWLIKATDWNLKLKTVVVATITRIIACLELWKLIKQQIFSEKQLCALVSAHSFKIRPFLFYSHIIIYKYCFVTLWRNLKYLSYIELLILPILCLKSIHYRHPIQRKKMQYHSLHGHFIFSWTLQK